MDDFGDGPTVIDANGLFADIDLVNHLLRHASALLDGYEAYRVLDVDAAIESDGQAFEVNRFRGRVAELERVMEAARGARRTLDFLLKGTSHYDEPAFVAFRAALDGEGKDG